MQEYVSSILRTDTHYQWTKITGRKKGARAPSIELDWRPIEGRKKRGPCSTDQRSMFIKILKGTRKLQDNQRKYLMGPRN